MGTFKHILAATDFSEASRPALDLAVSIARDSGADLTVVHTCEVPPYADITLVDLVTPLADVAQTKLDALLVAVRNVCPRTTGVLKVGVAWEQILAVAGEATSDLIILGTHGRRGVAHALMGSVAERVVRLSPIPVLTVRSRVAG
ncbi:MAG TPA: universal stress protein [Anaeromyxobacter sp.]|nr:universal stress protein [Anaeromyxobacter sp.]